MFGNLEHWIVLVHLSSWPMAVGEGRQISGWFALCLRLGEFPWLVVFVEADQIR